MRLGERGQCKLLPLFVFSMLFFLSTISRQLQIHVPILVHVFGLILFIYFFVLGSNTCTIFRTHV